MIGSRRRGAQGLCVCGFRGVAFRSELVALVLLDRVVVRLTGGYGWEPPRCAWISMYAGFVFKESMAGLLVVLYGVWPPET
jgi:hypothetical protein